MASTRFEHYLLIFRRRCRNDTVYCLHSTPILVQPTYITRTQYTKCRWFSASWRWAGNARNVWRPLILNKLNIKCITLVLLYWYTTMNGQQNIKSPDFRKVRTSRLYRLPNPVKTYEFIFFYCLKRLIFVTILSTQNGLRFNYPSINELYFNIFSDIIYYLHPYHYAFTRKTLTFKRFVIPVIILARRKRLSWINIFGFIFYNKFYFLQLIFVFEF
jgi:hypothetical protein